MNIDKYTDAIRNCRFCFMCRHLSGIGNVTFTEADTPRIRASMIYGITMYPEQIKNPSFIKTIYRSDLSAACRRNCVSHYDENGLNLAARADIVEAGLQPEAVKALAKEFGKRPALKINGKGDVIYYIDEFTAAVPAVSKAFAAIMKKAGVAYRTAEGGCMGKAFRLLGYLKEAKAAAKKFVDGINSSKAKVLVVSNPAAYDALVNDLKEYGVKLNVKVMHTSEYIAGLKLNFKKSAGTLYYLESDFLRNYCGDYKFPYELLRQMKAKRVAFGTNDEESYTCGEGAVLLPKLYPELVDKLAAYIEARADHPDKDLIVTASPYTRLFLSGKTALKVVTFEELAAGLI